MVEEEVRRGVEVTAGEARLEEPPIKGDTAVAEDTIVAEDAAIVDDEANGVDVPKDLETAAVAGPLVLIGRRDSLSLSIF